MADWRDALEQWLAPFSAKLGHKASSGRGWWIVVFEHDFADDGVGALARTEDILQLALFEPGDGCGRDHAAVGDDADPADRKALPQAVDDREKRRHVGGVARPHLGADRRAFAVDDEAEDHLLQVGPVV